MKNLFFLLLCLFCISTEPTLYAQKDIFLQEFTDSTMFNFVGTAQLFNKRIRLTEAKNFMSDRTVSGVILTVVTLGLLLMAVIAWRVMV